MHDRIADEHDFQNVRERTIGLLCHFLRQLLQRRADGRGHFLFATRIHHHVGDAAHQVFAEADLRVHQPR